MSRSIACGRRTTARPPPSPPNHGWRRSYATRGSSRSRTPPWSVWTPPATGSSDGRSEADEGAKMPWRWGTVGEELVVEGAVGQAGGAGAEVGGQVADLDVAHEVG